MHTIPLIFNLFPRYFHTIGEWQAVVPHAARMRFNHIFVNPFHATGFSGSLYAVKDYYRLNPSLIGDGRDPADLSPLQAFVDDCSSRGIRVMMDLVINHTAIDSVLVATRPHWFVHDEKGKIVSPFCIDPDDPHKKTVWGDLAKIDHEGTPDRDGLWRYFDALISFFQDMHIRCFRCDAAYQIGADLWHYLIANAKKRYDDTAFFAETLGCRPEQTAALKSAGFDYLFNSSKWWHFDAPWCLEQHERSRKIAPSISFPETHDTERLAGEEPGTITIQKSRYVLAAIFSKGLLMPMGYEYGARIKMDVVRGTPQDGRETPAWDLTDWIREIHHLKLSLPVLSEEGRWQPVSDYDGDLFFMEKGSTAGNAPLLACINKKESAEVAADRSGLPKKARAYTNVIRPCVDPTARQALSETLVLQPAEILLLV